MILYYVFSHSCLTDCSHQSRNPVLLIWSLVEIHYEGERHMVFLFLQHPTPVCTFHRLIGLPTKQQKSYLH